LLLKMGEAARLEAQVYSWERTAKAIEALYLSLVK